MKLPVKLNGNLYYEIIDLTEPWLKNPPTLVLSHGIGTNCEIWNRWLPLLAHHVRLVRFDTRGFGRSSRHGAGFEWSADLWAEDILAVADAAGAERFHLMGESLAGAVSLHLAAGAAGSRLATVTTVSSPYRGIDLPRVGDWRARLRDDGIGAWSQKMMEQRFHPDALSDAAERWFAAEQETSDPETLIALGDMLMKIDLSDALPRIRIPALLLAADASPYVTPEIAVAMKRLIPRAELAIFPHTRHGLPFSHAVECAEALLTFWRRNGFLS
jgi:3-oxoadipate enol-lactonase